MGRPWRGGWASMVEVWGGLFQRRQRRRRNHWECARGNGGESSGVPDDGDETGWTGGRLRSPRHRRACQESATLRGARRGGRRQKPLALPFGLSASFRAGTVGFKNLSDSFYHLLSPPVRSLYTVSEVSTAEEENSAQT